MARIISFSLGNLWRWSENGNVLINYARRLDVSGVEITFDYKEELYSFNISEENKEWLRSLSYVSIHAPFKLVRRAENDKEIIKQLNKISKLYKEVNAKNVIIHPTDLPRLETLLDYDFNISTENLVPKEKIDINRLKKVMDEYYTIGLCLDVAHAYLWSKHETAELTSIFKERISQVHLSGTYKKKDHQSMRKVSKDFLSSIEPIKSLEVPIVIEEDIKVKNLDYVKEEVNYIKKLFDNS